MKCIEKMILSCLLPEFLQNKKPLHMCGKKNGHKECVSPLCCEAMTIGWWLHTNFYYSQMVEEKEPHLVSKSPLLS